MDSTGGMTLMADFNSSSVGMMDDGLLDDGMSVEGANFSSNFSEHSVPFQGSSSMMTAVISLTVFLVGLTGNTLAIYVVLRYAKMKTVTNIYILNLAVADVLFMLSLPFIALQLVLVNWPFGLALCRVVMTVDSFNQFTSIFCLTVMSIDRYLAVVHPIRSAKWRRPQVAKAVSVTVWLLSFIMALPVVVFAGVRFGHCNIIWPQPASVWPAAFIIFTSIMGFFFPLLVICLCYLLIVVKIRSSGKKVHATSTKRRKSERKVTRMVVIVVAVFVLCWLPFYMLNILNLVVQLPREPKGLYYIVVVLLYTNSCANPIIYGFMSDNFKRGFRKALCRSSRRVDNHEANEGGPRAGHQRQEERGEAQEEELQQLQQQQRCHMLKPRESLRRAVRGDNNDEEEEEEEEEEEVTEMTEICKITQNGNGNVSRQQAETSCALLSDKVAASEVRELISPDGRGAAVGDILGKAPGFGPAGTMPALLNGAKNGSVKPLPEEPVEKNPLLEISYL